MFLEVRGNQIFSASEDHHSHSCLLVNAAKPGMEEALPHKRLAELVRTCCFSFWDLVLNGIME